MISLNSAFMTSVDKLSVKKVTVVNISSGSAITPSPTMSLYCTGKAARHMFFKVMAQEEKEKVET